MSSDSAQFELTMHNAIVPSQQKSTTRIGTLRQADQQRQLKMDHICPTSYGARMSATACDARSRLCEYETVQEYRGLDVASGDK